MKKPLLFLIFNRLDTVQEVFEQIKIAKPPRLYISSDAAREHVAGEKEKVQAVRDYVMSNIDWECEVKTKFNEENMGCGKGISSALTWFFECEEDGIILEDDCVPTQSFFSFCEEMLDYYKDNKNIWMITGNNFINLENMQESYYFSKISHVWGWATWADRWENFKLDLTDYDKKNLRNISSNCNVRYYWNEILSKMKKHEIDTWDYPWLFAIIKNKGLCVIPKLNMVKNIGVCGAHFDQMNKLLFTKTYDIDNIIHPSKIKVDEKIMHRVYTEWFDVKDSPFIIKIKDGRRRYWGIFRKISIKFRKKKKDK